MKPKLIIVTGNPLKFRELSSELSKVFDCEQGEIDSFEIQGTSEEILRHKLQQAFLKFKQPVLVDDTSVHFEELNGFPGPYMKDFFKCFPPYEMGIKFTGSRIQTISWLGLCRGKGDTVIVKGVLDGTVVTPKIKDPKGREFDLFTQADGTDKPMIEFSTKEKNEFSHRGKAMKNLLKILKKKNK